MRSPSSPRDGNWKQPSDSYDRELYQQRNRIERCFNALKHFRRFSHTILQNHTRPSAPCTAIACSLDQTSNYMWIRPRDL